MYPQKIVSQEDSDPVMRIAMYTLLQFFGSSQQVLGDKVSVPNVSGSVLSLSIESKDLVIS